jgi:hypothetical protein
MEARRRDDRDALDSIRDLALSRKNMARLGALHSRAISRSRPIRSAFVTGVEQSRYATSLVQASIAQLTVRALATRGIVTGGAVLQRFIKQSRLACTRDVPNNDPFSDTYI